MRDKRNGTLTISLDFELYWGMRDKISLEAYRRHLLGVWEAVPKILALFEKHEIHATWATVGLLFLRDGSEFDSHRPQPEPRYDDAALSPYGYFDRTDPAERCTETFRRTHFARELIDTVAAAPYQEIATHTYSHFYTREPGYAAAAFDADMAQAVRVAEAAGVTPKGLVFPRNQIEDECLETIGRHGIEYYRGNPEHWAYREGEFGKTLWQRLYRLADSYADLSGSHATLPRRTASGLTELKSSIFLRSYKRKLRWLEGLKRRRVKRAMRQAAQRGENFHLWWHPHNFGVDMEENLANLRDILEYFDALKREYDMESLCMEELVRYYD